MSMETDKLELRDDVGLWIKDVKKLFQDLYDQYRAVQIRNEVLETENIYLRSEQYKDSELAKMKSEYDKMKDDYYRGFPISEKEMERVHRWMNEMTKEYAGSKMNTGRFYYRFYPTALGVVGVVIDSVTGKEFTFQEI